MGSNPDDGKRDVQMSRRQWLVATGAVSASALAGCSGDGEDGETEVGGDGGDGGNDSGDGGDGGDGGGDGGDGQDDTVQRIEQTYNMAMGSYPPTDMNFNAASPNNSPHIGGTTFRGWAFAPLGRSNSVTGDFDLGLLEDYTYNLDQDPPNVELSFPEGWTWWPSGNEVTAEDFASQLRLGKYGVFGKTDASETVSSIEVVDDYTLRMNLKTTDINKRIWTSNISAFLTTEHEKFADGIKSLAEADGRSSIDEIDQTYGEEIQNEDAVQEAVNRIQDMSIDEPFGNGPFKVTEHNQQEFIWGINEDHALAPDINWTNVEITHMGGDAAQQAFVNGRMDFTGNLADQFKDDLPEWAHEMTFPAGVGPWLLFQMGNEPTDNVHFRRAVMHLVDRAELAEAMGSRWEPIELPCGLHRGQAGDWLSNPDSFIQYEPNKEAAAKELKAGGWELDGDKWVDGDGNPLEVTVKAKAGNDPWVTTAQLTNARLQEFGVSSELLTEEGTTYHGNSLPNGDYQIAVRFGGGWSTYPYFSMADGLASDRGRSSYDMPESLTVPPVGEPDAEPTKEIEPRAVTEEIAQTADEERVRELIELLAWTWNYHMPFGCTTEQLGNRYMSSDGWEFPKDAAEIPGGTPRPGYMAIEDALKATEE